MSHHIYHTEAIVLGSHARSEGDRMLYCYTRELGLVLAHAKSLREGRSRLRYVLQTFAHVEIDLVRGRSEWKLISAQSIDSFASLWRHPLKRRILAEHTHLLRRLIQGEERHELLFDEILRGLRFLSTVENKAENEAELRAGELVLLVRMLSCLGYWSAQTPIATLATENVWTKESLQSAHEKRATLLLGVNQALAASQL
jgi:recombinational DNA repair protein (RecF pathway)